MLTIIILTLVGYWALSAVIYLISKQNNDVGTVMSMGLLLPVLWVLTYPIRANNMYNASSRYYQTHGISKAAYMFGKRVRKEEEV